MSVRGARLYVKSLFHTGLYAVLRWISVGPMLLSRNATIRYFVFNAIGRSGYRGLLISYDGAEAFVHQAGDRGPGRELFIRGTQDFSKFEMALRLLKAAGQNPIKHLVDAGANIGAICIPAVRRGYVATVLAIEAVPDIVRLLKANIEINGLSGKIAVVNTAITARSGEQIKIALSATNQGDNRIASAVQNDPSFTENIMVVSTTLDDLLTDGVEDTLIWMDIQGHEGIALLGAPKTLARKPPMVLEFCPLLMRQANSYDALKSSTAAYRGFHDLSRPGDLRPLRDLDTLSQSLGFLGNFTDILLVP